MLSKMVATLVVALLQWLAQRRDIKQVERLRMAVYAAQLANKAQQWKLDNPVVLGDPLSDFRVQSDPSNGTVSGSDPKTTHAPHSDEDERDPGTN